jgi:acetyl esterase/lipase
MDDAALHALVASTALPVARINYRTGTPAHPFPVPLHDLLAGYERVVADLASSWSPTPREPLRVGVCGQLFGGTLATALALTESRRWSPRNPPAATISAAAVSNPIFDWTAPERAAEDAAKRLAHPKAASRLKPTSWELFAASKDLPAASLLSLRRRLFGGPDAYIDAFASPMHFFRAPAVDAPRDWPDDDHFFQSPEQDAPVVTQPAIRKARRIFPPTASDLELPALRVTAGIESALRSQCEELVKRVGEARVRACLVGLGMNVGTKVAEDDERPVLREAARQAREKYVLHSVPGVGLWGVKGDGAWEQDVADAGQWFDCVLSDD